MGAGYYGGRELTNRWYLLVQFLCQGLWDVYFQADGLTSSKAYAIVSDSGREGYNGFFTSIQPYWVGNKWAGGKELADFQLADLPTGSCLHPSLR